MGIDPSLLSTGVCYTGHTEVIKTSPILGMERLVLILREISERMDGDLTTHACIEGYYITPGRMMNTIGMAELGGAIKLLCRSRGLPTIVVPPATLKKYITGKGNADKQMVMQAVKKRWGKSFTSNDMADAYGLFMFGTEWLADKVGVRRGASNKVSLLNSNSALKSISMTFSG